MGVTIHELANAVKVSTRTIRRDLQALQEAGFSIYDEGEENETKRWRLDAQPFRAVQEGLSVADVAALYLSRSIATALSGWPLADELGAALAKIERALNPRMREFLSTLPKVISTKNAPRASQESGRLIDVTRRLLRGHSRPPGRRDAVFSAQSRRAKSYTVEAYRLTLAQGGVYLIAWVPGTGSSAPLRSSASSASRSPRPRSARRAICPRTSSAARWASFQGPPERIEIEFDARIAPYVGGRVWHESQQVTELADGGIRLTLNVSNDWALQAWLLGFGSRARVISPRASSRPCAMSSRSRNARIAKVRKSMKSTKFGK